MNLFFDGLSFTNESDAYMPDRKETWSIPSDFDYEDELKTDLFSFSVSRLPVSHGEVVAIVVPVLKVSCLSFGPPTFLTLLTSKVTFTACTFSSESSTGFGSDSSSSGACSCIIETSDLLSYDVFDSCLGSSDSWTD